MGAISLLAVLALVAYEQGQRGSPRTAAVLRVRRMIARDAPGETRDAMGCVSVSQCTSVSLRFPGEPSSAALEDVVKFVA